MKIRFDIKQILKLAAIFSVIVLLSACGRLGEPSTASEDPVTKEQISEQQMFDTHNECWQAALVGTIYQTTGKLTMSMYRDLSRGAMALMMTAFAIWQARLPRNLRQSYGLKYARNFLYVLSADCWQHLPKAFYLF